MVTMLKNKCSVWKRIKFPTFWYNCYYFTWSDTYFIQLETLLINHPSYKDLTVEIQSMWNVKAEVKPVIIGVTGTISKSLRQYLSNIPGKYEIKELQQRQPYWTLHTHTAETANVKVQNTFNVLSNSWHVIREGPACFWTRKKETGRTTCNGLRLRIWTQKPNTLSFSNAVYILAEPAAHARRLI